MNEKTPMEWTIEIGRHGGTCRVFCNGEPLYPESADVHMAVNDISTLTLRFPEYAPAKYQPPWPEREKTIEVSRLTATGTPVGIYLEIGDRVFRVMELTQRKTPENRGLFGETLPER